MLRLAFMTLAIASFYAGDFPGIRGGVAVVSVLCVALSIILELAAKFAVPVFFKADITATADPLAPDPKILTRALKSAFDFAAARGHSARLLVSRIPGHDAELRINAANQFFEAEITNRDSAQIPKTHKITAGKLVPRRSPAVFVIKGDGSENALICVNPDGTWNVPFPCEPRPATGWKIPVLCVVIVLVNLNRAALL